eukprot:1436886-Rhodomonas_salina.1
MPYPLRANSARHTPSGHGVRNRDPGLALAVSDGGAGAAVRARQLERGADHGDGARASARGAQGLRGHPRLPQLHRSARAPVYAGGAAVYGGGAAVFGGSDAVYGGGAAVYGDSDAVYGGGAAVYGSTALFQRQACSDFLGQCADMPFLSLSLSLSPSLPPSLSPHRNPLSLSLSPNSRSLPPYLPPSLPLPPFLSLCHSGQVLRRGADRHTEGGHAIQHRGCARDQGGGRVCGAARGGR